MFIRLVLILSVTVSPFLLFSFVEPVRADTCSVKTIVKLIHRGKTRDQIRRQCSEIDVRRCSLTQVVRMAEKGKTSRDIYKQCQ